MSADIVPGTNVQQAVPFLTVANMANSLRYYVAGLGFKMTTRWPQDGSVRWCWLQHGGAALMLQEFRTEGHHAWIPQRKLGEGVSICFICEDALAIYREITSRGVEASWPVVSNGMWNTEMRDPDGYSLQFESLTDVPEETRYSETDM